MYVCMCDVTHLGKNVYKKKIATPLELNATLSVARTDNKCEKIKFKYFVYLYVLIFPQWEGSTIYRLPVTHTTFQSSKMLRQVLCKFWTY